MNTKTLLMASSIALVSLAFVPAASAGAEDAVLPSRNCAGSAYHYQSPYSSYEYYRCTGVYTGSGDAACVGEYRYDSYNGGHCTGVQGPPPRDVIEIVAD